MRIRAKSGLRAAAFAVISAIAGATFTGIFAPGSAVSIERISVTSERILVDPMTGLALGGYDPVAYFADGKARPGKPQYELPLQGAVWRFANEGNLEAFRLAPKVYMPQFGGHDALSVSRGYPAQGSPLVWAIHGDRLYFFSSPVSRAAWLQSPDGLIAAALHLWPEIEETLVR